MTMDGFGYEDEGGRSRWLKIGGGVLVGVVLLAAGFGVGRLSAPAVGSGGQQAKVSGQNGPGPWRVENGVPVGYAHTQEGAVAAATNFVAVKDGPLVAQPDKYRSAIDTLAAPDAKAKLRSDAEKSFAAFQNTASLISSAQQGRAVVFRTVPLAYQLNKYDGRSAQVTIWSEGFIGVDGILAAREVWGTTTYGVEWVSDDWRLSAVGTVSDGPVPVISQPSMSTSELPPQLKTFRTYRYDLAP
jgi:hypothetical protein